MPQFYFHLLGDDEVRDLEGVELPDLDAALSHAVENARDCAAHDVRSGKLDLSHRIEVADAEGRAIASVRYGEVIEVTG